MKQKRKCLLALALSLGLLLGLVPAALAAGLTIPGASCDADGVWRLTDGTYTVSGTAASDEAIEITGNVTLTLDSASLLHTTTDQAKAASAIAIQSGSVNLVLSGTNQVQGSAGYAGIYVAPGANLTLSGQGSLTATGGATTNTLGGGAGIGGNGGNANAKQKQLFGTVVIESGKIFAFGGETQNGNLGAGAGIGSGGGSMATNLLKGSIQIRGGEVTAVGGDSKVSSLTGGAAGLGSGGAIGGGDYPVNSEINIKITNGKLVATGKADGAGIGGGTNTHGGVIEISGGNVQANGGYEIENGQQSGGYGGAGIGGGDNGGVTSITIIGGTVTARATGAAAGIGGGNDGAAGTILIGGTADVTAYGGSHIKKSEGGAGIGCGRSYSVDAGFDSITITDSAKVHAYAGKSAQAIGVGTYYGGDTDPNKVHFDTDSIVVHMYNRNAELGAFWGQQADGKGLTADCSVTGSGIIWYTGEIPAPGVLTEAFSSTGEALKWQHTADKKIQVFADDQIIAEADYTDMDTLGHWALVDRMQLKITYHFNDGSDNVLTETLPLGSRFTLKQPADRQGYRFLGWKLGDKLYQPGDQLESRTNLTFIAQWQKEEPAAVVTPSPMPSPTPAAAAQVPVTGDQSPLALWAVLCLLCGAALVMGLWKKRA